MEQPKVGTIVLWYEGGDRAHGAAAAIVTATSINGIRVNAFFAGSTQMRTTAWIRHVDDPYYITHPNVAAQQGAWDWVNPPKSALDKALAELDADVEFAPFEANVSTLPEIGKKANKAKK